MSSASGEVVENSQSEQLSETSERERSGSSAQAEEFKNSGVDVAESQRNVIGDADGSPVVVQTGTGIKVLVEVPRVDVRVGIADFLRFVNRLMNSAELKAYLGAEDDADDEFDELIAFIRAVVARAGKYFLLPGLLCELCIVGKLVIVNNEVVVKVETPVTNSGEGTAYADISEPGDKGDSHPLPTVKEKAPTPRASPRVPGSKSGSFGDRDKDKDKDAFSLPSSVAFSATPSTPKRGAAGPVHEDDEEDFWANHKVGEEGASGGRPPTPSRKKEQKHDHASAPRPSDPTAIRAAYVKISMNMMDVIEDHKVLTSLGQDLILAMLSRDISRRRRPSNKAKKTYKK
jgi:hypothetical protein